MSKSKTTKYQSIAAQIRDLINDSPDSEQTAYHCARLGLLALMFLRGPQTAAETAYRLADEMSDAAHKFWSGER